MRDIKKIIIHCSDSDFGDAALLDKWHKERGWEGIGYHYVILNSYRSKDNYKKEDDGLIEFGRPVEKIGAHCKGENADSVGILLIGRHTFTAEQLLVALPKLMNDLSIGFGLVPANVYGHYEFEPLKTCPNISMEVLRNFLRRKWNI